MRKDKRINEKRVRTRVISRKNKRIIENVKEEKNKGVQERGRRREHER